MQTKTLFTAIAMVLPIAAAGPVPATAQDAAVDEVLADCIRTVMKLDEGRWAYMGTIARFDGSFRTYETTTVHRSEGTDIWSSTTFGGNVGGTEEDAEKSFYRLIGTSIVPVENGEPNFDGAVRHQSCTGPDAEGRYEVRIAYRMDNGDGTFSTAQNLTWYSKHGSYYAEDVFNEAGRITARRSGVYMPVAE